MFLMIMFMIRCLLVDDIYDSVDQADEVYHVYHVDGMIFKWAAAKNRYTWSVWGQRQVHSEIK